MEKGDAALWHIQFGFRGGAPDLRRGSQDRARKLAESERTLNSRSRRLNRDWCRFSAGCVSVGREHLDCVNFRGHMNSVRISYDPAKREATPAQRGLDFEDAAKVFGGVTLTLLDDRHDYGEPRFQTYGLLDGRLVMLVWTPRDGDRHVISMRKCNAREKARFEARLG